MRLATWNIEWFDSLFDRKGNLLEDGEWSSRRDNVTRRDQASAIAAVMHKVDADVMMIIEAPDRSKQRDAITALEGFAHSKRLRTRRALLGFTNDTQQEIALLYNPDIVEAKHEPMGEATGKRGAGGAPRFDGVFRIDLDIDAVEDTVRFSKPPLEGMRPV